MFAFKPLCGAMLPLILACGVAKAQDKQPVAPRAFVDEPVARVPLSQGHIKLGDSLIVAGERIGPIKLNATRKEVEAVLGVPGATMKMHDDLNYSTWRWAKPPEEAGRADFFEIIFEKDRVVQIEVNASTFPLPGGLTTQSSELDWRKFWKGEPVRQIVMMSVIGSPFHLTWKQRGFALEIPWSSRKQTGFPIQRLIVLPKNQLARTTFGIWSFSLAPKAAGESK